VGTRGTHAGVPDLNDRRILARHEMQQSTSETWREHSIAIHRISALTWTEQEAAPPDHGTS
jgi:hypothetical protein